jgi:DNA-binding CsgD family transcriptional regulator
MYDVYKLRHPEQPFPRTLVGSFGTPTEIMDKLKLDAETVFRMVCGETIDGMQVERSAEFLRVSEPMTHEEIAKKLGITRSTVKNTFSHGIHRLEKAGVLRQVLEMIRELRDLDARAGNHGGSYDIEMTTTIKISADAEE